MVDVSFNNPAGRLWHIFDAVKAGASAGRFGSQVLGEVWGLGAKPDAAQLFQRVALDGMSEG